MTHPATLLQPLTPEQITASRDRLLAEGFHPDSKAVRVHERLLAVMLDHPRHTEAACQSMEDLKAECERFRDALERIAGAIGMSDGRMRLMTMREARRIAADALAGHGLPAGSEAA